MSRTVFIDLMLILSFLIIVCNCAVSNTKPAFEEYFMEHEVSEKEAKQEFREIKEKIFKGEFCFILIKIFVLFCDECH